MIAQQTPVQVQFVYDVSCVWSYLAYARFRRALARYRAEGGQVELLLRPFQTDPDASSEGKPLVEVLREHFGADVDANIDRVAALGAREGLEMNVDHAVATNTLHAHRLVRLGAAQGLGEQMTERLFRAYYTDGVNVGDVGTLMKLANEVGVLWSDEGTAETRNELDHVRELGITGVPVFLFPGASPMSGAQSELAYQQALQVATPRTGS